MAKSTYISENTTQTQIDFMLMLDDNELDTFTLEEIKSIASSQFENINEIIENLVQKNYDHALKEVNIVGTVLETKT